MEAPPQRLPSGSLVLWKKGAKRRYRDHREATEFYIRAMRGEGWEALPERYDDGGFTGADIERPALQRLLADIDAGKVDIVVVYKVDRLSRSLLDFAQLLARF
jgi:site-specific DNA recombinase